MKISLDWKRWSFYTLCALFAGLIFSTALVETCIFVSLAFWLFWKWQQGRNSFGGGWHAGFSWMAAFTVFCALTFFWSDFPKQSGKGILKALEHFFLLWVVRDVFLETREKKDFETCLFWVFAVLMLDAGFQYFTGYDLIRHFPGVPASSGVRLTASFKNYGLFATFLLVTLPYMMVLAVERWRRSHWAFPTLFTGLVTAAGIVFLFLTRSRGGILAFAGSIVMVFLLRRQWKNLFLLLAFFLILVPFLPKRMIVHLDIHNREQSLVERAYLWERALQVIQALPLGGTGINTYAVAHERYDRKQNWRVRGYYAHNGYLQTAAETGLTGLALFLAGLALILWRALKAAGHASSEDSEGDSLRLWAILTGLLGFLMMALVDTILHNNQSVNLLWFFLGLCLAYADEKPRLSAT